MYVTGAPPNGGTRTVRSESPTHSPVGVPVKGGPMTTWSTEPSFAKVTDAFAPPHIGERLQRAMSREVARKPRSAARTGKRAVDVGPAGEPWLAVGVEAEGVGEAAGAVVVVGSGAVPAAAVVAGPSAGSAGTGAAEAVAGRERGHVTRSTTRQTRRHAATALVAATNLRDRRATGNPASARSIVGTGVESAGCGVTIAGAVSVLVGIHGCWREGGGAASGGGSGAVRMTGAGASGSTGGGAGTVAVAGGAMAAGAETGDVSGDATASVPVVATTPGSCDAVGGRIVFAEGATPMSVCAGARIAVMPARDSVFLCALFRSFQNAAALFCRASGERATARASTLSTRRETRMPRDCGVGRFFSSSARSTRTPVSVPSITGRSARSSMTTSAIAYTSVAGPTSPTPLSSCSGAAYAGKRTRNPAGGRDPAGRSACSSFIARATPKSSTLSVRLPSASARNRLLGLKDR